MVDQFLLPHIAILQKNGHDVHIACNFLEGNTCTVDEITTLQQYLTANSVQYYQIDFARNVWNFPTNLKAYKQLTDIFTQNEYDLIHCHSPIGGLMGRIGARKLRNNGVKVFYTAHGFHFFQGAPFINWLLYYPVEQICSHFTDVLITINSEDYTFANKWMRAKRIEHIPGVGIDLNRFKVLPVDTAAERQKLGIPENAFVLVSVGEISKRKNHQIILRALSMLKNTNIHYVIVGQGPLREQLVKYVKLNHMSYNVHFLGYRNDIAKIYNIADVCCFPSLQEGLPVALMEAMACGLPIVCSQIRGNSDLIKNNDGFVISPNDVAGFASAISQLANNNDLCVTLRAKSRAIVEPYGENIILNHMLALYEEELS